MHWHTTPAAMFVKSACTLYLAAASLSAWSQSVIKHVYSVYTTLSKYRVNLAQIPHLLSFGRSLYNKSYEILI